MIGLFFSCKDSISVIGHALSSLRLKAIPIMEILIIFSVKPRVYHWLAYSPGDQFDFGPTTCLQEARKVVETTEKAALSLFYQLGPDALKNAKGLLVFLGEVIDMDSKLNGL